jgi:hypothetical protein
MSKKKESDNGLPECVVTSHRLGDHMKILRVGLELTNAKLEVLCEVAKAWGMDLSEVIEHCVSQNIRGVLEGSNDTGKDLNKILCNTWLREIGEGPDEDNQGA